MDLETCGCEFSNIGYHEEKCLLAIGLIKKLEISKERVIEACDFESAAAIRDAIIYIRKARRTPCT